VRHTVAGVDDRASQRAVGHLRRCPGRGECQHGLNGDIETGAVKGLEEDLGGILAVLRRIQGLCTC